MSWRIAAWGWFALALLVRVQMVGAQILAPILSGGSQAASAYTGPLDAVTGAVDWWGTFAPSSATRGSAVINLCDNLAANCADVTTSGSTGLMPAAITRGSNTCASTGTCLVKIIYDFGSLANNFQQVTANEMGLLVSNCGGSGQWGISFATASSQLYATISANTAAAQPFTMLSIAERTANDTTYQGILDSNNDVSLLFANAANTFLPRAGNLTATVTASDGAPHVFQTAFNGASSLVGVDATQATKSPGTDGMGTTALSLGVNSGGSLFASMCWFGGGVYTTTHGTFSGTQMTSMYNAINTILGF
jgi:hypothetical protein